MPWTLENIKAMLAAADLSAALEGFFFLIGPRSELEKEALQWIAAKYKGLIKRAEQDLIDEGTKAQELEKIRSQLAALLAAMEEKSEKQLPSAPSSEEDITLTFISSKRQIKSSFKTSPHRTVGSLKEALIQQFNIDTSVPLDYDNPATYLVVNKTLLTNDRLSLLESGVKDKDLVQIDVQYHIRMIWNQSVPTRLLVTFVGKKFIKPRVIVNNMLIAKPICFTDDELEMEFYTYSFTDSIKDLLFNFRLIDGNECLEFQEVVNAKGKVIDLRKVSKQLNPLAPVRKTRW